ncbi:oxygen-dependent coproporphyrinogen oxidase [Persicobacter diffluens]|uniref:coproporphyrinogen oxidase n=1 Tax=Persicobacter diffluens TaxID=981 RepID=A0AAN4VX01_9BACT|nr:coproporphyrinogen oxidase [Persicobacter diffluens]
MSASSVIKTAFLGLQSDIVLALEAADGLAKFTSDEWERPEGGGGLSKVLTNGKHIAKGGVNFSAVEGALSAGAAKNLGVAPQSFMATGVSIVLHPQNPWVPIIHMNIRYFELADGTYWFGGGIDLTPHYIFPEDAAWFHHQLKLHCDQFADHLYPDFKKWADDYFFIPHRNETRGVGGIFFDRLVATEDMDKSQLFDFVLGVGQLFSPIYLNLLDRRKDTPFGEQELQWQRLRRGRYVEFNLVWDRGTKFGLETNGRTESILMSLPPQADWMYDFQPEEGSKEAETLKQLKKEINWLQYKR